MTKDRYMKNAEVAKMLGQDLFQAVLQACDPNWRFIYPEYIGDGVFNIPDYIMGRLAEINGYDWHWPDDKHPMDRKKELGEYREEQKKREQEREDFIKEHGHRVCPDFEEKGKGA